MERINHNHAHSAPHMLDDKILQDILTDILLDDGMEEVPIPNEVHREVTNNIRNDEVLQSIVTPTLGKEGLEEPTEDDINFSTLPIYPHEVFEEGVKEPKLSFSLGRPITWSDLNLCADE